MYGINIEALRNEDFLATKKQNYVCIILREKQVKMLFDVSNYANIKNPFHSFCALTNYSYKAAFLFVGFFFSFINNIASIFFL